MKTLTSLVLANGARTSERLIVDAILRERALAPSQPAQPLLSVPSSPTTISPTHAVLLEGFRPILGELAMSRQADEKGEDWNSVALVEVRERARIAPARPGHEFVVGLSRHRSGRGGCRPETRPLRHGRHRHCALTRPTEPWIPRRRLRTPALYQGPLSTRRRATAVRCRDARYAFTARPASRSNFSDTV